MDDQRLGLVGETFCPQTSLLGTMWFRRRHLESTQRPALLWTWPVEADADTCCLSRTIIGICRAITAANRIVVGGTFDRFWAQFAPAQAAARAAFCVAVFSCHIVLAA
jgi:hypothetical protein